MTVPTLSTTMSTPRPSEASRTCSSYGSDVGHRRPRRGRRPMPVCRRREMSPRHGRRPARSRAAGRRSTCRLRPRRRARRAPGSNRARRSMRRADDATSPDAAACSHESDGGFDLTFTAGSDDRLGVGSPTVLADDAEAATERHVASGAGRAVPARGRRVDHHLVAHRDLGDVVADRIDDAGPVGAAHVGERRRRRHAARDPQVQMVQRRCAQDDAHLVGAGVGRGRSPPASRRSARRCRAGTRRACPRWYVRSGPPGGCEGEAGMVTLEMMEQGLAHILGSPRDEGTARDGRAATR